jgi:hypothetical protein
MIYIPKKERSAMDSKWLRFALNNPLFLSCNVILAGHVEAKQIRKIVVPVMAEYAVVAHPTMPRARPTSNTTQARHLFRHKAQISGIGFASFKALLRILGSEYTLGLNLSKSSSI